MKNQLFHYPDPIPNNNVLPNIEVDPYDPKRIESSDILSPKMPQRNMPLLSDGHRPPNHMNGIHNNSGTQIPQLRGDSNFLRNNLRKNQKQSYQSNVEPVARERFSHNLPHYMQVDLSNSGDKRDILRRRAISKLPRLSSYLQYQEAPEIIFEV